MTKNNYLASLSGYYFPLSYYYTEYRTQYSVTDIECFPITITIDDRARHRSETIVWVHSRIFDRAVIPHLVRSWYNIILYSQAILFG